MNTNKEQENGLYPNPNQVQFVQSTQPNFLAPGSNPQIVIVNQQPVLNRRLWTKGLCDCFDDCGECAFAYFCPCCYACSLFSRAGENCCSCLWGGFVPLRTKIRTERGIEGSICCDFWTLFCCGICAAVQMGQELKLTKSLI